MRPTTMDLIAIQARTSGRRLTGNTLRIGQAVEMFEDHKDLASAILLLREAGKICVETVLETMKPSNAKLGAYIAKDLLFNKGEALKTLIDESATGAVQAKHEWDLQQKPALGEDSELGDSAFH